jgi:hypothetical protein
VKNVLLLVGLALFSAPAFAGDPGLVRITQYSPASKPRDWTRENWMLVAADAAAKSADMFFTMRNAGRYDFVEHDPLARPFVTHGRALAGISQGALFSADLFLSHELYRHAHSRLARVVLFCGAAMNSTGAVISDRRIN